MDVDRLLDFERVEEEQCLVKVVETCVFVGLVEDEVQLGVGHLLDSHALELLPVSFGRLAPPRQNRGRAHCAYGTFP